MSRKKAVIDRPISQKWSGDGGEYAVPESLHVFLVD
jgi:hypothetical protein